MIRIIGNEGCSRCEITKQILTNKEVQFTYELLENLPDEDKKSILKKARVKGILNMPLILKDEEIIDIKEII